MAAQAVLIAVLVVVGAAAAVPFVWLERNRWRRRRDSTALVLGGAVLSGGQGVIAFGLFAASAGDLDSGWLLLLPPLIVAGALLALGAAFRLEGLARSLALLAAAALSVAGSLAGGLFLLAGFAALLASVCYLLAIADNPRDFLRRLDPRD
ncbi:MAG: hypothetical protein OXE50_01770 [Chloroflexi bacterium]|nr:hypothetical protein [Chloroflexota bacterium]